MTEFETLIGEELAAARADAAERVRQQHSLSEKGLGSLLIANGGALIGLFTFVGNAVGKEAAISFDLTLIWASFWAFSAGVALTLSAYLLAFLSQDRFYFQSMHEAERWQRSLAAGVADQDVDAERRANSLGMKFYNGGIVCAAIAIFAFMIGCGLALAGVLPA